MVQFLNDWCRNTGLFLDCLYITQQVQVYFREGGNEQVLPSFYTAQLHRTTAVFLFQIRLVDWDCWLRFLHSLAISILLQAPQMDDSRHRQSRTISIMLALKLTLEFSRCCWVVEICFSWKHWGSGCVIDLRRWTRPSHTKQGCDVWVEQQFILVL